MMALVSLRAISSKHGSWALNAVNQGGIFGYEEGPMTKRLREAELSSLMNNMISVTMNNPSGGIKERTAAEV